MIGRGSSLFEICGFAVQATRARHFLSSRSTSERKIFNTERLVNKKTKYDDDDGMEWKSQNNLSQDAVKQY